MYDMLQALPVFIAVSALLTIVGKYRSAKLHYLFKPLTMLLVLYIALSDERSGAAAQYQWLIVAALLFSLAGDVFLMLPRDRFVIGLASFLVAHLIYGAAFVLHGGLQAPGWLILVVALFAFGGMGVLLPRAGALRIPVAFYIIAIAAMALTAVTRALQVNTPAALLAAAGALLFVVSDSLLGWNRFVKPFVAAEALLLATYFGGQMLIALSV